jgi:hypothetical protein
MMKGPTNTMFVDQGAIHMKKWLFLNNGCNPVHSEYNGDLESRQPNISQGIE